MDKRAAIKLVKRYIKHLLANKYNIKAAWLFGSYANGKFTKDSDIDVALVLPVSKVDFDLEVELMTLRRDFELSIEPHPFSEKDFNSDYPFADEIKRTGLRIM